MMPPTKARRISCGILRLKLEGGGLPLFTSCREEVFSETQFPACRKASLAPEVASFCRARRLWAGVVRCLVIADEYEGVGCGGVQKRVPRWAGRSGGTGQAADRPPTWMRSF